MNFVEYFNKIEVIDEECVKKAYDMFGKDRVRQFFNNIENMCGDNPILIQKINEYLKCASLVKELRGIENDFYDLIRVTSNEPSDYLSVSDAYFKEISKYPLLSLEEEKNIVKI